MKMMIKFSDETIKAAHTMWFKEGWNIVNGVQADWRAAAAVFEVAANAQVELDKQIAAMTSWGIRSEEIAANTRDCVEAKKPISSEAVDHKKAQADRGFGGDSQAQNKATVDAIPEPFQVGKRYRSRGGRTARVIEVTPNTVIARYSDGLQICLAQSGLYAYPELPHVLDLLPGSIDAAPAESATLTDEQIGTLLWDAWGAEKGEEAGWLAVARCARELLQPQNKHNETYECVIADLTQQVRDANARAERVVAAIERAIPVIKAKLEGAHPGSTICLARDIAEAFGLTITPARELTVTWNKDN
jgi:hypothetical protein